MHIGLILDGNRRWAQSQGVPKMIGHKKGIENFKRIALHTFRNENVNTISAFALSTENLQRSAFELKNLFRIFLLFAKGSVAEFRENNVSVRFLGRLDLLPKNVQKSFSSLTEETASGVKTLNICVAYGGRDEIIRAAEKLCKAGEEWSEENFARHLDNPLSPPMDLLIRTGGKNRISNFMLWEAAYAEIYFSDKMWPDFSVNDISSALQYFKKQTRTFGK